MLSYDKQEDGVKDEEVETTALNCFPPIDYIDVLIGVKLVIQKICKIGQARAKSALPQLLQPVFCFV